VVVGDEGAADVLSGVEVAPDRRSEREDALGYLDGDSLEGPPAVLFQVKRVGERPQDGQPGGRADEVESPSPEPARMRRAVLLICGTAARRGLL
jgi:hypothetical protein